MSLVFRICCNINRLRGAERVSFGPLGFFSGLQRFVCVWNKTEKSSKKKIGNRQRWEENVKAYCDWNVKKYYSAVGLVILVFYYYIEI